jgi:hypothetical protein
MPSLYCGSASGVPLNPAAGRRRSRGRRPRCEVFVSLVRRQSWPSPISSCYLSALGRYAAPASPPGAVCSSIGWYSWLSQAGEQPASHIIEQCGWAMAASRSPV